METEREIHSAWGTDINYDRRRRQGVKGERDTQKFVTFMNFSERVTLVFHILCMAWFRIVFIVPQSSSGKRLENIQEYLASQQS